MMLAATPVCGFGDTTPDGDSILIAPLREFTWKMNDALVSWGLSGGGGGNTGPDAFCVSVQATTISAASAESIRVVNRLTPARPEVRTNGIRPPEKEVSRQCSRAEHGPLRHR